MSVFTQTVGLHLPDVVELQMPSGPVLARGLSVGNLFVRAAFDNEYACDIRTGQKHSSKGLWIVALPLTTIDIATSMTLSGALLIADELSRWVPDLHEARDEQDILRMVCGRGFHVWILAVQRAQLGGDELPDYRTWRARGES